MIGIGALYFLLGIMCCKKTLVRRREIHDLRLKKWEARVAEAKMRAGSKARKR